MRTPRDFRKEMIMLKIFMITLFVSGIVGMYFFSLGRADSRQFLGLTLKVFSPTVAAILFAMFAFDKNKNMFHPAALLVLFVLLATYVGGVGVLAAIMFIIILISAAISINTFKSESYVSFMLACIGMAVVSSVLLTDFLISICVPLAILGLKRVIPEFIKM